MDAAYIALLLLAALGANLVLGMWRAGLPKFSPSWFVAIHASIPFLIAMRLTLVPTLWVIPPEIALAFVGQFVGARLPYARRTA
jgi:hypothetical protein